MTLNVTGILDAAVSHAMSLGLFEQVNQHEPKNAPGKGLTVAIWADRIQPIAGRSGLAATTIRITFMVRIYSDMIQAPQDDIDPNLLAATDVLMAAYTGDFDLNGTVEEVDVLGASGTGMSAQAGYLNQDNKIYRVMEILLPVIVNDVWAQSP